MPIETLPLFPLHTVLLPGASLGLRVFEARYLDLVRECGRSGRTFGICLILEGAEASGPALPAAVGTEAVIEDFDTGGDGLLTLSLRGARRFRARRMRVRDNGLQVAEIEWIDEPPAGSVRPEHAALVTVLRHMLERRGGDHARAAGSCFNDAAWVGWRLAELLPLPDEQRQALLQIDDPHERLELLLSLVG
ncbi:LON peptidase substrate-binding domain-containing protein [Lysobacter korlensis]|uniref:LON peptidase substrate-binding domain-containing protein n=1 Tax=Lysobacter korlensis TaxID=553636 RepID=A0ABV6RTQ1_9GAMM